jgi:hypothetical protein
MLYKYWATQHMELDIVYENEAAQHTVVHYVNRGGLRDVWGDHDIAVKLHEEQWHDQGNLKDANCMQNLADRLPNNTGRVIWVGKARFTNEWQQQYKLSCLIMQRQGADLLVCMRSVAARIELQRGAKLQLLLDLLFAYAELFVQAWDLDCFLDSYGLRHVCLKKHIELNVQIHATDLALVDVNAIASRSQCGKGKIPKLWGRVRNEMTALFRQIGVHLDRSAYPLLWSMTKENLQYDSHRILVEMQKASEQLMVQFGEQAEGLPPPVPSGPPFGSHGTSTGSTQPAFHTCSMQPEPVASASRPSVSAAYTDQEAVPALSLQEIADVLIHPQDLQYMMEAELEHLVVAQGLARYPETRQFLLDVISCRYGSQAAACAARLDLVATGGTDAACALAVAGRLAAIRQAWQNNATRYRSLSAMLRLVITPLDAPRTFVSTE